MKILFVALTLLALSSASANQLLLPIRGVTDGDTIQTVLTLPCPLCNTSVRIRGIDTPESLRRFAQCDKEVALGLQAKDLLRQFVLNERFMVATNLEYDKYGGRLVADVNIRGTDIATLLINNGFAVPYTGSGPKPNWCL